ncbi:MAG: 23S rRNA (guanosine(2251)-2'-O)-methyltransferase RlmB [Bacteroidetes bacterium]|nr:MAG: 23S rRNA (guanosine(2251)-2'-O)-methyltransferase RlmB [Bacteroidota bacterium]
MKEKNHQSNRTWKARKEDEFMIFGVHAVLEAIRSEKELNKILIQKGIQKEVFQQIREATNGKDYFIQYVPVEKLNKLTQQNHQGIIAYMAPIGYHEFEPLIDRLMEDEEARCILFLDRLTDVRNFGAIARTAECMGVDAIVIPAKSSVQVTSDAIKTSSGALNRIPVCRSNVLKDSLFYAQQSGFRLVACTEKTSVPLEEANLRGKVIVIMGSEEDGISSDIMKMSDVRARIPMKGDIASLNVGVATGMILYERQRQLSYKL